MRPIIAVLVLAALAPAGAAAADASPPGWQLAWEDNFDRVEVGDGWLVTSGKASIRDGRLLLEGGGATILTTRPFKPDVMLEFDAQAVPGVPACDLSATIGGNPDHGYGYLFAFGARYNQVNQLLGRGVRQVDEKPPFVIEHGKTYHIVARQEGKRLTYTVNGVKLLDAVTDGLAAGPGFDRVGLVTWTAMLVDNVRVHERIQPHPDTPEYPSALPPGPIRREGRQLKAAALVDAKGFDDAISAFNSGNLDEALRLFRTLGDSTAGLIGQAYVICDLAYSEKLQFRIGGQTEEFARLARAFEEASRARPSDTVLAAYSRAAQSLPRLIMSRSGMTDAIRLVALGPENNPFYHKARLYEARYHYWNGAEGGNQTVMGQAREWMANLKKTWPENTVLRQYTGEQVPWGEEIQADTENHPAWAAYLREAYARQISIMERFFTQRQQPDGQLGGGYGDDVELMRTWMQIASISSASETVRAGIERLAEGVWNNVLKDGFDKDIGDVEHSAEPSADTLPAMLLMRYGDPVWVERNLRSCRTIRGVCMGIDNKGYPRFRSAEIGADGVNTHPRAGGDTGYHARAMKHFIWQAWWGDADAKDWFVRWCDGWRAATMAQIEDKMPGFVPWTIWYPSGGIGPPGGEAWHDPSWHYYGDMSGMVHDCLLCAYYFTRDPKFLKPMQLGMDIATAGPLPKQEPARPSVEWQRHCLVHVFHPLATALYKWLTGERVYDEYTRRFGGPALAYRLDYDLDKFQRSFEAAATSLRTNLELQTTEVLSTDRAELGSALTVFGAYTGAISGLRDAATPTFAVTYETDSTDFAALVTESTPKRLRVWLYSFADQPAKIGLKLWQLVPGSYILNQGALLDGEYPFQHRYAWQRPRLEEVTHRAKTIYVAVPARTVWVVDLRLDEPKEVPSTAPDLAISPRDLKYTAKGLQVTVHNIGNAPSPASRLVVKTRKQGRWRTVGQASIPAVAPPRDLKPSFVTVAVPLAAPSEPCQVTLDPDGKLYEICETNNIALR